MRQIVLDTETTGIEISQDHRIIEIGCVELVDRKLTGKHYHQYINPEREVDAGAYEVHGISNEFLSDKPLFAQVADEFFEFISGAELVIHNAPFDVGFMDHEFAKLGNKFNKTRDYCSVIDTLVMARKKYPGQKNNLDALCKRYHINNAHRELHGALLDAEILAEIYLAMTGGQVMLGFGGSGSEDNQQDAKQIRRLDSNRVPLTVITATDSELAEHQRKLQDIEKASGNCVWLTGD